MSNEQRLRAEIDAFKKELRQGDPVAASNIAATYRQLGRHRLAFQWWRRAASGGNGDAWVDLGYAHQHGIGTRRNSQAAIDAYRKALRSPWVTQFATEEAQYHLAVTILEQGPTPRAASRAEDLLRAASTDGDYPQANDVLKRLANGRELRWCTCRRRLRASLGRNKRCELHGSKRRLGLTSR